jgi:PAS domain S-box-containing protein
MVLLRDVARGRTASGSIAQVLQRIVDGARQAVLADGAFVEQVDITRKEVEVGAVSGSRVPRLGSRSPYPGSLAEQVIEEREPEIIDNHTLRQRLMRGALAEICGDCTGLILPLLFEGEAVGALVLLRAGDRPGFTSDDMDRLLALTDVAALAVRRTLLLEESEQSRRALEESERKFRLLVEGVKDYAIFMLDADGLIQSWNAGAERIKGYTEDEVIGRHFSLFYPAEDQASRKPQRGLAEAAESGRFQGEGWRVRKDGSLFWASVTITAIRDDDGQLLGFSKVTRDLTEWKRLEEARLRETARYRAIYEENPSVYLTTDSSGTIINANAYGADHLGYSVKELIGTPVLQVVHEEDRGRFLEHMGWCLQHPGEVHRLELRKVHRDGTPIWMRETARAVRESDQHLVILFVCEDITERLQAEAEREQVLRREQEAHEQVTRILDSITDAFFALDTEWRFTYLNRGAREAVEQLLGQAAEKVVGGSFWDVVPQFQGTRFEAEYRRALAEQVPAHFEEYAPAFGVWFEVHAYPSPEGLSVYFRDITRRKRAEEALRDSEEQFRQIAENVREVFWISDPQFTQISYVSPAYEEVFERSPDSLYADPRSFLEAILPEDRPRVEEALEGLSSGEYDVEYRVRRADGGVRWIWARGFPVRNEHGEIHRIVGIAEDLTERKEAEEINRLLAEAGRLLASSLEFEPTLRNVARLAVSNLADWCLIDLCEDGEIQRVAVETADPEMEAITREYASRYPPDPAAPSGGPHVIRTGEPEIFSEIPHEALRAIARDEEQLQLLLRLGLRSSISVPLRVQNRILGAITFVSVHRRYGPDDLRFAELLADRAALSVEKARLYREAQAATAIRDEVLSVVSHDLRNPLNTILMSSGFLCDTLPEGENAAIVKQLNIIRRSAKQGSRLIGDLLDIARIEAGRLALEPGAQTPRALVLEACESLRPLAEEKNLVLDCATADGLPAVHADRDRVLQVFSNLVGNAIKFTPEGGRIAVRAELHDAAVQFSVSDTGPGIDAEDIPHLFNRFYQAKHSQRGGAGLGLAIARGIVEGHGGRIWVDSEKGKGSTFFFTLPRA